MSVSLVQRNQRDQAYLGKLARGSQIAAISVGGEDISQAVYVSCFSILNCVGRLCSGCGSPNCCSLLFAVKEFSDGNLPLAGNG